MTENNNNPQQMSHDYYYAGTPLDSMYPEVYNRVYPVVRQMCQMYDLPSNPDFNPYPREQVVYELADQIYRRVYSDSAYPMERQTTGGLLRPLILILLVRELIRRRGFSYTS